MLAQARPVTHNSELVSRAAELATLLQCPPTTTIEARELLAVKDRRTRCTRCTRCTRYTRYTRYTR